MTRIRKYIIFLFIAIYSLYNAAAVVADGSCLRPPSLFDQLIKGISNVSIPFEFLGVISQYPDDTCIIYNSDVLSGVSFDIGNRMKMSGSDAFTGEKVDIECFQAQLKFAGKDVVEDQRFLTQFTRRYPSKKKVLVILDGNNFRDKDLHPIVPYLYLIPHKYRFTKTPGGKTFHFYMFEASDLSFLRSTAVVSHLHGLRRKGRALTVRREQAYKDAILDGVDLIAGTLIPQSRTRGLSSRLLEEQPDFVVTECRTKGTYGILNLCGEKVLQNREDLNGEPLLAIRRGSSWAEVINKNDGEVIDLSENESSTDAIFIGGEIKAGRLTGGEFVGVLPRFGADEELRKYKNPVICNVSLDARGGLFKLNRLFFRQKKGYEGHKGAMIVCDEKGEPVKVYAADGNLLWFDPMKTDELAIRAVYVGGRLNDNMEIEGGELVYASEHGIPERILMEYPDCIIANIDIMAKDGLVKVGSKRLCERPDLAGTKGYTAVQTKGRIVYLYDSKGEIIYSNTEKDRGALFTNWRFEDGRIVWFNFVHAFEKEIPSEMLGILPDCAIANLNADIHGGIGSVGHRKVVQNKPAFKGRDDLTVVFNDSKPIAVCDPDGNILHTVDEMLLAGRELEQLGERINEDSLLALIRNFGALHAFNIVRRLCRVRLTTVTRLMYSYLDILSDEEKQGLKGTGQDMSQFLGSAGSIFRQIKMASSDAEWLSSILIQYMYRFASRDMDGFLKRLEKEIQDSESPEPLISAYKKVYRHYLESGRFKVRAKIKKRLFQFQKEGVRFMLERKRTILADECGLGKTIQVIAAALSCKDKGADKILIVSPKGAMEWWKEEITASTEITEDEICLWDSGQDFSGIDNRRIVIVNYEAIRGGDNPLRERLLRQHFDFIAVDEAHRMRNESLQAEALLEFDAEYKVLITATPLVGSKIKKIFHLAHWLYPEMFPSLRDFLDQYSKNPLLFRNTLSGFMLSRTKSDVAPDIPERRIKDVRVELTEKQEETYRKWRDDFARWYAGDGRRNRRGLMLSKLEKLRQAAVSAALVDKKQSDKEECLSGSGKYNKVMDILKGERGHVVIFTRYLDVVEHLRMLLESSYYEGKVLCLRGKLPAKTRNRILREFRTSRSPAVLICTYGTAGQSLNIQAASASIFIDYQWTYQEFLHAMDRIHRLGQTEPVKIYRLISSATVDEHILKMLKKSEFLHRFIMASGDDKEVALQAYDINIVIASLSGEFGISERRIRLADEASLKAFRSKGLADERTVETEPILPEVADKGIHSSIRERIELTLAELNTLNALQTGGEGTVAVSHRTLSREEIEAVADVIQGNNEEALHKKFALRWRALMKSAMMKLGARTLDELPASYERYRRSRGIEKSSQPERAGLKSLRRSL